MTNKEQNDLISVIVPIYNTGEILRRCIDSILNQIYSPIEILLVDDGSTDDLTIKICDEYAEGYGNIKVIHQSNGGPSKARNVGIENARGEYIGFVDSDDYIDKDGYLNLYRTAVRYQVPLVLGAMTIDGANQHLKEGMLCDGEHMKKEILSRFMLGDWHSACTNLYSRSLLENIRFPLNEINEDYIFNFNVLMRADKVSVFNKPFYYYIKQDNSRTGAPASLKHLDWLKHTQLVEETINNTYCEDLRGEAEYQNLFANITLANKCLINMAEGIYEENVEVYMITTGNLCSSRHQINSNRFFSKRYKFMGMMLSRFPNFYKTIIISLLKITKWIH